MTGFSTDRRQFLQGAAAALTVRPKAETIAVVGAGPAGLAVADTLRRAGRRVIVLEARAAPGGRVRTIRGFADGLHGEAGAARIAETHALTLNLAQTLGLRLVPFAPAGAAALLAIDGQRCRATDHAALAGLKLNLTPAERGLGPGGLLDHYLAGLPAELADPALDIAEEARWRDYDAVTWPAWLRSRGASPDAVRLMCLGGDSAALSALYVLRQVFLHRASRGFYTIAGGMDRLPRALAARLAGALRYGVAVTRLDQDSGGVRLGYVERGRVGVLGADRVVLALPFSTLRRLTIRPGFSAGKRRAIETLPYYAGTRILTQSRTRFWTRQGLSGSARTDRPAEIWDASFGQAGTRGLLSATAGGALGAAMLRRSDADCIAAGIGWAAEAFPELSRAVERATAYRWTEEPWARGAFAIFHPGQMTALTPDIARPEGRVHFAGEHTSPWMGWMEGALQSADRVAREILQA